jgi:serine/threonine protein kinase
MQDPDKPEFSYTNGLQLTIQRHDPPPPFGGPFDDPQAPFGSGYPKPKVRNERSHTQFCLDNLPLETQAHPSPEEDYLTIVEQVAAEDGRGAQVVLCYSHQSDQHLVAKIFDPLYYVFEFNPVKQADMHYSREAGAYQQLLEMGEDGKNTPRYYGSWTFNMPLVTTSGETVYRPVRMVLIECIDGSSMKDLIDNGQHEHLASETRLDILGRALEIDMWLRFRGIKHNDFAPRNILLSSADLATIFVIDFNQATVRKPGSKCWQFTAVSNPRPANPLNIVWVSGCPVPFAHWIPQAYNRSVPGGDDLFREWAKARWYYSDEFMPLDVRRPRGVVRRLNA